MEADVLHDEMEKSLRAVPYCEDAREKILLKTGSIDAIKESYKADSVKFWCKRAVMG